MPRTLEYRPMGHRLIIDWEKTQPYSLYRHKHGGVPSNGATLPGCIGCGNHLHLVFQIDLADPSLAYLGLGNLDYLYVLTCLNCRTYETPMYYRLDRRGQTIQVLHQKPRTYIPDYADPLPEYPVSCRMLTDDEYPLTEEMVSRLLDQEGKHQVGGMPIWIQREEHIMCPNCEREMEYIAMADSELYIEEDGFRSRGHMFGDEGILYVFLCRQCEVLATKAQGF